MSVDIRGCLQILGNSAQGSCGFLAAAVSDYERDAFRKDGVTDVGQASAAGNLMARQGGRSP
jgi:hypothetical protein